MWRSPDGYGNMSRTYFLGRESLPSTALNGCRASHTSSHFSWMRWKSYSGIPDACASAVSVNSRSLLTDPRLPGRLWTAVRGDPEHTQERRRLQLHLREFLVRH